MRPTARRTRLVAYTSLGTLGLLSLTAFRTFSGSPRWPLAGGFHYVADLNTVSFPPSSPWDASAQWALSDWRDIGATSFTPGFRRSSANAFVNNDGINAWMWSNQPAQGWLGVTYYRYANGSLLEADVVFNSRNDFAWALGLLDPSKDRSYAPFDFRGVARHETGHAIGLDHEDAWCCQMNTFYERGTSIPHTGASGELPHADDKFGCRFLYPVFTPPPVYNLMATCWQPGAGQVRRMSVGGTYQPGNQLTVPLYIQNQSNRSFPANERLGIYLSQDDVISVFDTRIADVGFTGSWTQHGEAAYAFPVTLPLATPPGQWHVGAIIDWSHALAESHEGDNVARLGVITVSALPTPPDLVIENLALSTTTPARGAPIAVTGTLRNLGTTAAAASQTVATMTSHGGDPAGEWVVGWVVHGTLVGSGSVPFSIPCQIPDDVCAERTWYLRATGDWADSTKESNEDNNWQQTALVPAWERAPGYKLGAMRRLLAGFQPGTFAMCAKSVQQPIPAQTWHLVLWTCSGTSPGIPLPQLGVLPLNYDVCTDFGLALNGHIVNAMGPLSSAAEGSTIVFQGDTWLAPLRNVDTHFAALFFDATTFQLTGLAPTPVTCSIY